MATRNSTRLTDKFIRSLKPPATGNIRYTDSEVPGLAIRITAADKKAFTLDYRIHGRNRRYTISPWPEYNALAARNEAIELRKGINKGIDPLDQKYAITVSELAQEVLQYMTARGRRARTIKAYRYMLEARILPALGKLQVPDVTPRDIERLHLDMADVPYLANKALRMLHRMFNLAMHWGHIERTPVRDIDKYPEEPRNVTLDQKQIKKLVQVLDAYPDRKVATAIMLILLTGCRKTEALSATWSQFDLDAGVWTKPSHHTKQKRLHRVPLNPAAIALLEGMDQSGDYLFPGNDPDLPLKGLTKPWEKIRTAAGMPGLRVHDLRHVYASLLASQNLSLPVIGALLGHTQAQTTSRYAHLLDAPLRDATNGVGKLIEGVRK